MAVADEQPVAVKKRRVSSLRLMSRDRTHGIQWVP